MWLVWGKCACMVKGHLALVRGEVSIDGQGELSVVGWVVGHLVGWLAK